MKERVVDKLTQSIVPVAVEGVHAAVDAGVARVLTEEPAALQRALERAPDVVPVPLVTNTGTDHARYDG